MNFNDVSDAAATMLASLGRGLPKFLSELSFRERVVAVGCIDSVIPFPDVVYECFIVIPDRVNDLVATDPKIRRILDGMGVAAKADMERWGPEQFMSVLASITDMKVAQRTSEAQAHDPGSWSRPANPAPSPFEMTVDFDSLFGGNF